MNRAAFVVAFILILLVSTSAEEVYLVSGVGNYPISDRILSMWLAAPDRRPLIMVFFCGLTKWHDTQWKVDSKFEKGKPGWAELQSERATLRVLVDVKSGEAGVQSTNFKTTENNTFLVLHMAEPSISQKIIPLGVFSLPPSTDQPAPVLLLKANPELTQRIKKEVEAEER